MIPSAAAGQSRGQGGEKPMLVVNIVVGGMRSDDMERYRENLPEGGFRRFCDNGVVFTESRYDFMQTNTPATLATLTTGANPSVHGVVGEYWQDYVTGRRVRLIDDPAAQGLDSDMGVGRYSAVNLTVPALGDALRRESGGSKVVTIAADPVSAVAMGGMGSEVYWLDVNSCNWTSSSKYMPSLPDWVVRYNNLNGSYKNTYRNYRWTSPLRSYSGYVNSRFSVLDIPEGVRFRKMPRMTESGVGGKGRYENVLNTPVGNELLVEFVKQAIIYEDLGQDGRVDILNVCFDAPRNAARLFGPESMEAEDMFYRTDRAIASLVEFVDAQFRDDRVLWVLTSDHGTSDSCDVSGTANTRFNTLQFKTIIGTFLGAQFGGEGGWVADYYDRRLYLNRTTAYNAGVSLADVQRRAADYALQFRGVSHALTSSAMQSSTFTDGYMRKIQNGFYPKRSGDMVVNLMAGWMEEAEGVRSASGSLYDYDTHVPLVFMGCGLRPATVDRSVDMCSVAVTLARILHVSRPAASTAEPIPEVMTYWF
jgi:hypothetical protein